MPFWKRKKSAPAEKPAEKHAQTLGQRADTLSRAPAEQPAAPLKPIDAPKFEAKFEAKLEAKTEQDARPAANAAVAEAKTALKPAGQAENQEEKGLGRDSQENDSQDNRPGKTREKTPEQRLLEDPVRIFGEVSSLMARDPAYAALPLSDLSWIVRPALASRQVIVARTRSARETTSANGVAAQQGGPIAFVVWAYLSDEIDAELKRENGRLAALKPHAEAWRSGQNLWIVALCGPEAVRQQLVAHLKDRLHAGGAPAQLSP